MAHPTSRGAATIMALARADGIVVVPRLAEGFAAGQEVTVYLLRPLEDLAEEAYGSREE